ncbi:hypothetical protein G7Y89_g15453 [Cudoniella acicularis]|uniref:Uncharacterized protein n=1 Tax=Cudoniella acicularis TaxID=354080 RepID=A0A8H4QMJ1_9HELO|nr:hypothetical protein G7Y89_g15453 [Cudoniella acicularis]
MLSFDSVRRFVKKLGEEVEDLDVALLNAGIAPPKYVVNESTGWEEALQVNILSTALLAILLMPKLKATAAKTGRVAQLTFTGSLGHTFLTSKDLPISEEESLLRKINSPEFFNAQRSYIVIKLLTMYVMRGLIDDFSTNEKGELDVAVNVVCPGYCVTDLGRDHPWYIVLPTKIMQLYCGRSAEEGSRSLVSATLLGEMGHGKFWTNDVFVKPGVLVVSEEGKKLQSKAWKEIMDICRKEIP